MAKDEIQHSNLPVAQKAPDENFLAYVTAVSASNTIWAVVRTPDYARFCELTTQMTELKEESLERVNVASIGSLCLARFSVDNGWYRSRITQGNAEQVEVIFVDYGNTEWKHIHDLYQLPPGFADVPSQAQQFTLNGLIQTANSEIEQLMVKFLDSLVTDKTFFVHLVCSAPGCIPEVILKQNESHVSINQQMLNYREQQTLNITGQQNEAEKLIQSTEVLERSEALQEIFQQGTTSEPRNLMISYMSDNISPDDQMIASMTDCTIGDTLVNDRTSGIVSDNIQVNDPRANYVTCTTPPNNSITGFIDPSVDNPICDYSWEHVPEDFSKTVCVAKSISRKNSSSSYVSDNVPLFSSNADFVNLSGNNPVGNYYSENISESYSKSADASENVSSKNSSSSCVSDNVPASDLIPDFTPNDPMSSYVSELNPANQLPNTGLKPYMALHVPKDVLPSTKTFDILVCHFLTPSLFWIWFFDSAKGIFNQLSSMLNTTYEHSTYSEYLPINGELIAAKYTDGIWYRAAVECINSDGSVRVHFIDFGNSEDVSLIDVRRITAALATIPRLATKCALHGMGKPTGNWSTECVQFCNYLMLNKRGVATVRNEVQSTLFLSVDMDINGQVGSVVDELMKQGYFITNNMHTQDSDRHVIPTSSNDASNNDSATLRNQPLVSDNKPSFPESPTSHVNQPVSRPQLSFHHELPLPESKAAIPGSQSDISESATLGTVPLVSGTKLHLPASQPVSRNNNPVFPNMKPPLPCNQPIALNDQLHFPESKPAVLGNQPVYPNQNPALNPVLLNNEPVSPTSQLVFPENKPVLRCKIMTPLNKQPVSDTNLACDGSKLLISPNVVPSTLETNKRNILGNLPRPFETLVTNPSQSISVKVEKSDDAKPTSASPPSIHNSGKQFNAPSYPLSQIPSHTILDAHNVEPRHKTLLPLPTVPTTSFKVIVNDVLSADKFYAQMTDPNLVSQLHKCVRELNEYVTKTQPSKVENVQVGSFGCAKFSQDNVWYRAQVVNIDEQKYVVRFIDFGNIENVEPHMFLEAPEFFFQLAPQTICCRLGTNDHIWGKRSREMMKRLTLNKQLSCTVLAGSSLLQYAVQLQDSVGGEVVDIAEKLSEAMGCRRTVILPSSRPSSSKQASVFSEKVLVPAITASGIEKIGGKHEVYVCSTSHPTYFWVQSAKNVEILKRLQNDLEIHYSNNSYPPIQPETNSFCAFLSPINNKWYRVFVKSTNPKGGLLVHCVDFGYLLSAEERLLRPLEEKFLIQPIGAMLLSINNVEPIVGKLWSEEAIKYFRDKVQSKVVKIHLVFNSKARLFVDVYDPDSSEESSLRTALVEGGMAKETQKNSPKIEETQQKLASNDVPKAACEDQMSKFQNVPNSTSVDGHYNARSSSSQSQDLVCQGVSTINSESQDDIGIIQIPDSTLYEDSQDLNEVPDFFSRQDTNATHSSVSCNIPRNTNLRHQNTGEEQSPSSSPHQNQGSSGNDPSKPDVIPKENQLDVFVSWVDSPDSFWVQHAVLATVRSYASMSQQLNATCENSSEKILNPKLGDFCCSKFAGEWCRCKLVALLGKRLARVFYIDFGNCEDVELAKLKPLTEEFRVLPGQAMECTLADVHPRDGGWTPQSVQWLRDRILDKTLVAAVVQWSGDSLRVRLYDKSSSEPNASINSLMLQSGI